MTPQLITALGNKGTRRYGIGSQRRYDRNNRALEDIARVLYRITGIRIEDFPKPSISES